MPTLELTKRQLKTLSELVQEATEGEGNKDFQKSLEAGPTEVQSKSKKKSKKGSA